MTTLLIDADIPAYQASFRNEKTVDWGEGNVSKMVDYKAAEEQLDDIIQSYADELEADELIICLSDPKQNFRKQLNPLYKSNRADTEKPELLMHLKGYLAEKHRSFIRPRLEADDIMGILATSNRFVKDDKIIVSADKDMRTIPAKVWNPMKPEVGVLDISKLNADRFLMWQTITGDATDGYPGCIGAGPKSQWAEAVLQADAEELWDIVLSAYEWFGHRPEDALMQARMAFILRSHAYFHKNKKVRLWQPSWLL